jgi:uncharacterized protein (TIGR02145 family)
MGYRWQSGGTLYQKVMMDRNLGAIEASTPTSAGASETARGQFYYQWGRKDPFPVSLNGSSTLQLTGSGTFPTPVAGPQTIAASVQAPTTFYTSSDNWTGDAAGTANLWYDPNVSGTSGGKSIYDPCPVGWQLPLNGTWSYFVTSPSSFPWQGTSPVGRIYATSNSSAFYAVTGLRRGDNGSLEYVGTYGYYWSASPASSSEGMSLHFYDSDIMQLIIYRAYGFPVRCSQQ